MWHELLIFFFGVSLLFYCLFAGADFGAGILECFLEKKNRDEQKELITHAMGPVWEANHVWLILAVVIFFNGFPKAFATFSIIFHIPLTLMLFGIILRGCAFTFRHYDAIQDRSQVYYSFIFKISSLLTPFMLGMIAGGIFLTQTQPPQTSLGFVELYIFPWMNWFSFSVGIFTCVLFAFLAAVYLVGEAQHSSVRQIFIQRAITLNRLAIISGLFVLVAAQTKGFSLTENFLNHPVSLLCVGITTLILVPLWKALQNQKIWTARILSAFQIVLILFGWFHLQFPLILQVMENSQIKKFTFYNSVAPDSTLKYLLYALVIGSCLIFPSLFFLLKIFKFNPKKTAHPL